MNLQDKVFNQCFNAASDRCIFHHPLSYQETLYRLAALKEVFLEQTEYVQFCRLHTPGGNDNGACPYVCDISVIKERMTEEIFQRIQLWPEFHSLRVGNENLVAFMV